MSDQAWFTPTPPLPEKPIERRLAEAGVIIDASAPLPEPHPRIIPFPRR